MTRRLILPLLILALLIGGLSAVWGVPAISPSNSLLNPANEALYTVNNGTGKVITYSRSGWKESNPPTSSNTITLPSGAKCYGMAVGTTEAKLYVSVNNAASSAVRAYALNSNGIPTGTYDTFTVVPWGSTSSPTGVVKVNNRLFVADSTKVRIFNTDDFTFIKNITGELTGQTNLFGIAATPAESYISGWTYVGTPPFGYMVPVYSFKCKLYISRRADPGSIFVYQFDSNGDNVTYVTTITSGIVYPTYIKVVNGRWYVAVNGTDGVDIRVYTTATGEALQGKVKSGVTGPYGWTGFDVDEEGHWLLFKKAQNLTETSSKLYKIDAYTISGGGNFTAADTGLTGVITSDAAVLSAVHVKIAVTNSPNGTIKVFNTGIGNSYPAAPSNLKQYKLNGTTEIVKGGTTTEEAIITEFRISDPNGDHLTPYVSYMQVGALPSTAKHVTGETVTSGTVAGVTVRIRIPSPEGFTANGSYEWTAYAHDGTVAAGTNYGDDGYPFGGTADFIVNRVLPDTTGPLTTITTPTAGAMVSGLVTIQALVNDTTTGNSNISAAEYFIDGSTWTAGTGTSMSAADGTYNSPSESATAVWNSTSIGNGSHIIRARGRDAAGNWGGLAVVTVVVNNGAHPTVTSIDPNTGYQGQTVPIINLVGTGFQAGAQVRLSNGGTNINAVSEVVASATHITCAIPIPVSATVGSWDVTVINPDTQSGTLTNGFRVFAPGTAPTVTAINPNVGQRGSTISVTITGTLFQSGATVKLARTSASDIIATGVTVVNPTSITCQLPLPIGAQIGLWSVVVTNPDTQQGTLYNGFSVVSDLATIPTVTNVYPRRAPSTESTTIRLIGTNFTGATAVDIQTIPAQPLAYAVNSATMITATVPAGLIPGTYHLTVTNASGTSSQTAADTFEVMSAAEVPPTASMIINFNAADGQDSQSTLTWTNPADIDMASIEVRRYDTAYPASHDGTGTIVFTDIPTPGATNSYVNTGLTNGSTYYYVAFLRDTSNNWSAVDAATPEVNADTGTPSSEGPSGGIINLSITRDADAVGSSVTVKWQTNPTPHTAVKIYTKTGTFSATAVDWTEVIGPAIIPSGDLDTYTDASQVGNGTAKYYKILPATATLSNSDLTTEVVGKFDLDTGVEPEKFFISLPLVPSTSDVGAIIGGQAVSLDTLFVFDVLANPIAASTYNGSSWGEFAPGITQITSLTPGYAYGFATTMTRYITIVGKVMDTTTNPRPIDGEATANWIATAYPMTVSIQNAGLENSSIGASALDAGTIYHFDSNANLLDGNSGMSSHTGTGSWTDLGMSINTTVLQPGKGYMFTEPGAAITWTQPRPY